MDEVIVLLWIVVFSDGLVQSESRLVDDTGRPYTVETCEKRQAWIWAQPAEVYRELDYVLMFSECQRVVLRQVRQVK